MKKIYLVLFLLITSLGSIYSQVNLKIIAPPGNGATSQIRAPNGNASHAFMRGCFLVTQAELTSLITGSNVSTFGFSLTTGVTGAPVTGSITVYLENTNDAGYLKGFSYASAITGMTTVYNSTMTIPVSAGSTSIGLALAPTFTYTGGGIYVAYDWACAGPYSTGMATYAADNSLGAGGASASTTISPAPTVLSASNIRPCYIFGAVNTASNDAQVVGIIASGKVPGSFNTPQTVSAIIKNGSNIASSNISVDLNISGANTFTNNITIPLLAAGASTTITFAAYSPTVGGLNTISVTTLPDQNNANNTKVYTQSVTCNVWTQMQPSQTFASAVGFNTASGIIASKYNNPITSTLTAINVAIGNATQNAGNSVYGVLMNTGGVIMATTNTITILASMYNTFQSFTLTPQTLAPGTYYIGLAQTTNTTLGYFPLASSVSMFVPTTIYYTSVIGGGFVSALTQNLGYFGIEGVFTHTTAITATSASSVVCDGASMILTGNGANTYSWSTSATTPTISVSPTVATTYTCIGTNSVGCKATATVSLAINPSPTVTAVSNFTSVCPGSPVSLTASGGDTYTWSTGSNNTVTVANPTIATTYSVIGTNTIGCNNTATVAIAMNVPTITISSPTAICKGTSASLLANGANSYTWSTGSNGVNIIVTPTVTSTYSISGTNSVGCVGFSTFSLTVNPNPTITVAASPTTICVGESSTITANGAATYSWNTTATSASIVVSPSATTNYTVTGTNTVACTHSLVVSQVVSACVGIHENANSNSLISIFPNPNNGVFTIDLTNSSEIASIEIYNVLGAKIISEKINSGKNEISLQDQTNGIYFVYVIDNNKEIHVSKIVKQ